MDAWFEEDVEVFVHPKDPFKRIEVLPSRRGVRVEIGGKIVAESAGAMVLLETGLPARYYLPKTSVSEGDGSALEFSGGKGCGSGLRGLI